MGVCACRLTVMRWHLTVYFCPPEENLRITFSRLQMPNGRWLSHITYRRSAYCDSSKYKRRPPMRTQRSGSSCESKEAVDLDSRDGKRRLRAFQGRGGSDNETRC